MGIGSSQLNSLKPENIIISRTPKDYQTINEETVLPCSLVLAYQKHMGNVVDDDIKIFCTEYKGKAPIEVRLERQMSTHFADQKMEVIVSDTQTGDEIAAKFSRQYLRTPEDHNGIFEAKLDNRKEKGNLKFNGKLCMPCFIFNDGPDTPLYNAFRRECE